MSDYMRNVWITNGKLLVSDLEYQLKNADGTDSELTYMGLAMVDGNHVAIEFGRTFVKDLYASDTATEESTQRYLGKEHAKRQQRRREPKNVSQAYYFGWYNEWEEKKK